MDGYFEDCSCYENHEPQGPSDEVLQNIGTMTGGDQASLNLVVEGNQQVSCKDEEVSIPGSTICWRVCPVGMNWLKDTCIGWPYYESFEFIESTCKSYDSRYRIADIDAVVRLLDQCFPIQFSASSTNYCSPYLEGILRYVMKIPDMPYFDSWIGPVVECTDFYGGSGPNCAWFARFHTRTKLATEFDLFKTGGYQSALASGMCIRGE